MSCCSQKRNMFSSHFMCRNGISATFYCPHLQFKSKGFSNYRKIPKISPWAYISQRPFLRGLFLEGLIFGGAYLRNEICVSKLIGLALWLEVNLPFLLCLTLYLRAIFQVQAPGGLYLKSNLTEGFLGYRIGGPIFGGA